MSNNKFNFIRNVYKKNVYYKILFYRIFNICTVLYGNKLINHSTRKKRSKTLFLSYIVLLYKYEPFFLIVLIIDLRLTKYNSYLVGFIKIRVLLKLLSHNIADLRKIATHQVYSGVRQCALQNGEVIHPRGTGRFEYRTP